MEILIKLELVYLKISVNKVIDLEVFIVIAKWIQQVCCNFDPTHVTKKFDHSKKWYLKIRTLYKAPLDSSPRYCL